jgi:hypothetical protein
MAKIKSTLDLIMEKTKHLSLNTEEKNALDQQQLNQRVQAPLVRYLKGERDADYLAHELDLLPPEKIEEGKRLCLGLLMDRLSPREDNQRILTAVEKLLGEAGREHWQKVLGPLQRRFVDDLRQAREEATDRCREALVAAGLKGPALLARVDEQDPTWKEEQETRIQAFRASVKTGLQNRQM